MLFYFLTVSSVLNTWILNASDDESVILNIYVDDEKGKKHGIFSSRGFSLIHYPWKMINAPNC